MVFLKRLVAGVVDVALALHVALHGEGALEEVGGAAQRALLLEDDDLRSALGQRDRRGQAGGAGTDYDDISTVQGYAAHRHPLSLRSDLSSSCRAPSVHQ